MVVGEAKIDSNDESESNTIRHLIVIVCYYVKLDCECTRWSLS